MARMAAITEALPLIAQIQGIKPGAESPTLRSPLGKGIPMSVPRGTSEALAMAILAGIVMCMDLVNSP